MVERNVAFVFGLPRKGRRKEKNILLSSLLALPWEGYVNIHFIPPLIL